MPSRGTFGLVVDKRPESLNRVRGKGASFAHFVRKFLESGRLPLRHRIIDKTRFAERIPGSGTSFDEDT